MRKHETISTKKFAFLIVTLWVISGLYFPAFGLNIERYYLSVFTPNTDAFYWLTEAELKRVAY